MTSTDLMTGVPPIFRELLNQVIEMEYQDSIQNLESSGQKGLRISNIDETIIEANYEE